MPHVKNVIQITTHDSGRHFGCYGHPTLQTPVIDRLAADGIRFTNYYATVPICSASRCSQLTGLYPQSHGLLDLTGFGWRMRNDVPHASQLFKAAGYRTLLFGLQHEAENPERLEFDLAKPRPDNAKGASEEAAAFLRNAARRQQPFYAQIGFFETHTPFHYGEAKPDTEKGVEIPPYLADTACSREAMAGYQGAIRKVDAAVGIILEALRDSRLENDTLVVFTTDHGIEMPRAKWFLYDPGIAIGLIMRCPAAGLLGGRKCDLLLSNVDYLPTLLHLAGINIPRRTEGRTVAGELRKDVPSPVRDAVFGLYHKSQTRYVRTNRFKLIRHFDNAVDYHAVPVRIEETLNKRVIKSIELFDLKADPNEFNNLADHAEYGDTQEKLDSMLWQWLESVNDPLLQGPVRTPAYEAAVADYATWKHGK